MKRIFHNRKRDNGGFTLVELIVVIAVLAVLAGVAYPVYTGYIQKANEAADLALLGQVNESFQSALYDVGHTDGLPEHAKAYLTNGNTWSYVESEDVSAGNDALNKAFNKYFDGNESTPFKAFNGLEYDRDLGGFYGMLKDGNRAGVAKNGWGWKSKNNGDGSHSFTITDEDGNNFEYTLQDGDVDTFNGSTFGQNMEMSELMSEVDNVVQALKGVLGDSNIETLKSMVGGDAYLATLGVTPENYPNEDDYKRAVANAVVMQVAEVSAGLTADDVINNTQKWQDSAGSNLLAGLAATYAQVTAYANSDMAKDCMIGSQTVKEYYDAQSQALRALDPSSASASIGIIVGMMTAMQNSDNWEEYQSSAQYADDMNGYFSAMNALAGNKGTLVDQGAMGSGFADEDLGAILDALFGNGN